MSHPYRHCFPEAQKTTERGKMWQAQLNTQSRHAVIEEQATFISVPLWSGSRDRLPHKSNCRALGSLKPPKYTALSLAFS